MAHTLVAGTTESGKTTLVRSWATSWAKAGWGVLVLDPPQLGTWPRELPTVRVYSDPAQYLRAVAQARRCFLIVDESADAIGRWGGEAVWLATRSRHLGHSAVFVVQRPALLDRTIRDQCRYIACFAVSAYDARTLADEWPQARLERAVSLHQGQYLWAARWSGEAPILRAW